MYAFVLHAHQKIDRIARRNLTELTADAAVFPSIKNILHFEGANGPDAAKFKKHGEQPWHFVDPFDVSDTELGATIQAHYDALTRALQGRDEHNAAFEAAWLAHALVDGLTPAHQYPYEEKLEDLRGEARGTRTSLTSRALVKGDTASESIKRSLKIVGPKGLLTTHTMFEAGAYMVIAPSRIAAGKPKPEDIGAILRLGVVGYFRQLAREIGELGMYESFYETGWTPKLARDTRHELAPRMVRIVTLAWFAACVDAGLVRSPESADHS